MPPPAELPAASETAPLHRRTSIVLALAGVLIWCGVTYVIVHAQRTRTRDAADGLAREAAAALANDDWTAAATILEAAVRATPHDAARWEQLAAARLRTVDWAGFDRAVAGWQALTPGDTPLALQILQARAAQQSGNRAGALARWETLLAQPPLSPAARLEALDAAASLRFALRDWPHAMEHLDARLALADSVDARLLRFETALCLRQWDRADQDFFHLAATATSDDRVRELRPKWERARDALPALRAAGATLERDPDNVHGLTDLAFAAADAGLFAHAARDAAAASGQSPPASRPRVLARQLARIGPDGYGALEITLADAAPRTWPLLGASNAFVQWHAWRKDPTVARALEELRRADATADDSVPTAQLRADALRALGAADLLDRALRERGRTRTDWNPALLRHAVWAALELRTPLVADAWAERMPDAGGSRQLRRELLAQIARHREHHDRAIALLTEALALGPPTARLLALRAASRRDAFDAAGAEADRLAAESLPVAASTDDDAIITLTEVLP